MTKRGNFDKSILKIDCANTGKDIVEFISRAVYDRFRKRGIVIGLSGGLDSSVTAALCVKAIGRDKVSGLILPDKESAAESRRYAKTLARKLRIKTEEIDITSILGKFGVYRTRESIVKKYVPDFADNAAFRIVMPPSILESEQLNVPSLEVRFGKGRIEQRLLALSDYLKMIAATNVKHRVRMAQLYYYAEQNNYLVAGTTNLTEFLLGFFVKYGDGGTDIEPVRHLYKTQVYQLARYLKIPDIIIKRIPTPDTFNYTVSDERFYFRLPYAELDLLLFAFMNKIDLQQVKRSFGISEGRLKRIFLDFRAKYKIGEYLRSNLSPGE